MSLARTPARALAIATAVAALAVSPASAQGDAAAALLAKHRAFAGWSAGDGSITSWHLTRTIVPAGAASDSAETKAARRIVVDEVRRGLRYRDTFAAGPQARYDGQEGFNGHAFWQSNRNDFASNELEDRARMLFSLDALFTDAVSLLPGSDLRTAKIGEAPVDIVRVFPGIGFPIDLYLGPDGAYRRAVVDPEKPDAAVRVDIDGYVEAAPGKKIIGAYAYDSGTRVETDKAELNTPVSDEDLVQPSPRATWTFGSTEPVPIEFEHGSDDASRQVNVLATIDGHPGRFLLDSGDDDITLFGHFASQLGLVPIGQTSYSGVNGGTIKAKLAKVKEVAVGKNVLHDVVVTYSDGPAGDVDGILGYDFLAGAIVDVDLIKAEITILDPAKFAPTVAPGAYAFPVDLTSRQPSVRVTLRGNVDARPIIDTGDSFAVLLSSALSRGETVESNVVFEGVDGTGERSVPCVRLNLLLVGPYRYENSPVCFGDPGVFGPNGGTIGFDFLRHFNWTFDYPDAKLVLRPNGIK